MKRLASVVVVLLSFCVTRPTFAQNAQQAQLRVVVVDQSGAGIPSATVRLMPAPGVPEITGTTDARGAVNLPDVPAGRVQLHVESEGFAPFDGMVNLRRGNNTQTVTLQIAGLQEQVVVTDTSADDRRGNSMTVTLEQADIDQLPEDPDDLQTQLEQMTGGAGAVFTIDGFRGGRLPSRDQIRQIRFRMNSFSADNHDAGRVIIEIITRPGLAAWDGNANFGFRTDVLNARNAFADRKTPEQFRRFMFGTRGPLVKNKTSIQLFVDGNRSFDSTTIVAQTPEQYINGVVERPIEQTNVTAGFEHGLNRNQTLRFEYRRSQNENRNLGVGNFNLTDRAYTQTRNEDQVRTSLQSVVGKSALNNLRVQWNHTNRVSTPQSTATAIVVIDQFSTGGAGVSNETNNRTVDISDDFDFTVKKHTMRAGMRLEGGRYQQLDAQNANGTFTFSSLESYIAQLPTTYTQRIGEVPTSFMQYQLGVYWQDDLRINRNLSLSLGVREEVQTHLSDPFNVMPRFGYTWTPGWKTTLRGGYGIFYDWFSTDLYDQTQRVNGRDQYDLLILNPGYPDPFSGAQAEVLTGGRVQADPNLKMPYVHQTSIGLERPLTTTLTLQATVATMRGRDQLRSRDINAPNELGVRPDPTVGTITQIESTGKSSLSRMTLGATYRVPKYNMFMMTNYTLASLKNYTDSPLSLPANSLDPDAEWGPSSQDVRHRFTTFFNFPLPYAIRANINANASSGAPYTITTGRDDNGDGVTNDRPVGTGRNSARGDGRFELGFRITRGFGFGGSRSTDAQNGPPGPGDGGPPPGAPPPGAGGGPGGGGPGGGGPGGGGPGGGGFGGPPVNSNQRFTVSFYAQAYNLLNRTNFQNYSGNMLSQFFGQATSASQARRLEVGTQFRF